LEHAVDIYVLEAEQACTRGLTRSARHETAVAPPHTVAARSTRCCYEKVAGAESPVPVIRPRAGVTTRSHPQYPLNSFRPAAIHGRQLIAIREETDNTGDPRSLVRGWYQLQFLALDLID